jgi:hypothetical protein
MANNHYTNSVFVENEKPTATKLNTLDSNIDNGFAMTGGVLSRFGGDDRVIDEDGATDELEVTDSAVPDLNVNVATGYACISEVIVRNETASVLTIVAPTVSNRYDIVQISNAGVLSTKSSAEQAVPVEPSADADNIKLCAIYLPQNAPKIDQNDLGDGYIIDRRIYSLHPKTITRHVTFSIPGDMSTTGGVLNDGYYVGTSAGVGFTFGDAVTVNKAFIQCQDAPTGADLIFTVRNLVDPGSDTITLQDGNAAEEDASISLAFDAGDELAIECTQIGSSDSGSWTQIILGYTLT